MADDLELIAEEDAEGQPDLGLLIEKAMAHAAERTHTAAPGIVSSASSSVGTVSAQQAVSRAGAVDAEPIVPDIPVMQLGGAKGGLYIPVTSGDPCLLLHANRSLDEWAQTDGTSAVKPADPRAHDPSDAMALPAGPGAAPTGAGTAVVLWGDEVKLGDGTATERVVKGTAYTTAIKAWMDAVDLALIAALAPLPPGTTTAAKAALDAALSAKVKVS